jgi:hypothetical protein
MAPEKRALFHGLEHIVFAVRNGAAPGALGG